MTAAPPTPERILDSIRAVVDYDWLTEERDYEQEGMPEGHVHTHLMEIDNWLKGLGK